MPTVILRSDIACLFPKPLMLAFLKYSLRCPFLRFVEISLQEKRGVAVPQLFIFPSLKAEFLSVPTFQKKGVK